jgi:aspartyl-tRNA(Asn)/glutamyl-tRNA(Gln) amidotransferase subunit C
MLSKKDVEALAELSRMRLSSDEIEAMIPQLDSILAYVSEVGKIVSEDMPAQPGLVRNVMREDSPALPGGEYTDVIIANAPQHEGNYVKVKQIF